MSGRAKKCVSGGEAVGHTGPSFPCGRPVHCAPTAQQIGRHTPKLANFESPPAGCQGFASIHYFAEAQMALTVVCRVNRPALCTKTSQPWSIKFP